MRALAARLRLLGDRWDADTLLRQGIATEGGSRRPGGGTHLCPCANIASYPPEGPKPIGAGLRDARRHTLHNFGKSS